MHSKHNNQSEINLSILLEELLKANIEFVLVGGLAAVIQGAPITTIDVDIVHNQTHDNISKLIVFLKSINAYYRRMDNKIIKPKIDDISGKGHALFSTSLGPLDVLSTIENDMNYHDLLTHSINVDFKGFFINVLDLKMLVELKRTSKELKDKQRLPILEEVLKQNNS